MFSNYLSVIVLSLLSLSCTVESAYLADEVDALTMSGLISVAACLAEHGAQNNCTLQNAVQRKEWYAGRSGM